MSIGSEFGEGEGVRGTVLAECMSAVCDGDLGDDGGPEVPLKAHEVEGETGATHGAIALLTPLEALNVSWSPRVLGVH